jgi:outer membrane protein OmpA-like peptidoglycan-associated protein
MKRLLFTLVLFAAAGALAQEPDAEGCKDHPLFNRMPGYRIQRCEETDFEAHEFRDAKLNAINVEGRVFHIRYALQPGAKEPSRLQVLRNYENAATRIGGSVLKSDYDGQSYMKLVKDGKELWVHVGAYITSEFDIWILEKAAMNQDIVANAAALGGSIKTTGHVSIYGIYFDTGKSEIKPSSDAAIAEIAKLLKAEGGLNLYVVGHTDNVGGLESNMKLSQSRAEAVVKVLVGKHGIAAARLKGYGVGPLAPVASNAAEEGRAKNRRVELVAQ